MVQVNVSKRIGAAKGKIELPEDFDDIFDGLDSKIAEMFENAVDDL